MIKAVVRWQRRTVRAMALHFPLYRGCDLSSHWWCRSLNKRITCQLLLRYMGTVQTSMVTISNLKHESSNLTHSGTDGEGSKKQKHKKNTPRIPAAASYVCWLPRESTTARNPFPSRHSRADLPLNLWDKSIRRIRAGTQRSCHLSGIDRILYGRGAQNFREWISANGFPRMDSREMGRLREIQRQSGIKKF